MSWFKLVIAGLFEVGWAIGLKHTQGFTRPVASALTIAAIIASMWLLASATKEIPIGTAYAVWVGIGVTGATLFGVIANDEPLTLTRGLFLTLLVVAIVGLKFGSVNE